MKLEYETFLCFVQRLMTKFEDDQHLNYNFCICHHSCRWKARSQAILTILKNLGADFLCLQVCVSLSLSFFIFFFFKLFPNRRHFYVSSASSCKMKISTFYIDFLLLTSDHKSKFLFYSCFTTNLIRKLTSMTAFTK